MQTITMKEAVQAYGDEFQLLALVGGGKSTNGKLELMVCDYRKLAGYDPVLACAVYENGKMVRRFNVK